MMKRGRLVSLLVSASATWAVFQVGGAFYRVATGPHLEALAARTRESAAEFDAEMAAIQRSGDRIRAEMVRINPEWSEIMGVKVDE